VSARLELTTHMSRALSRAILGCARTRIYPLVLMWGSRFDWRAQNHTGTKVSRDLGTLVLELISTVDHGDELRSHTLRRNSLASHVRDSVWSGGPRSALETLASCLNAWLCLVLLFQRCELALVLVTSANRAMIVVEMDRPGRWIVLHSRAHCTLA
jgi:hypothetical protein